MKSTQGVASGVDRFGCGNVSSCCACSGRCSCEISITVEECEPEPESDAEVDDDEEDSEIEEKQKLMRSHHQRVDQTIESLILCWAYLF